MRVEIPESDTETYEHIPWSRLTLTNEVGDRGRWMYYAAGLLVVAAVAAVVARVVWKPSIPAVVPSTVFIPPTVPAVDTSLADPIIYSEADLMATASDPESSTATVESFAVGATAEQFVREWVQRTEQGWNYVEWVSVRSVEKLDERFRRVTVLFQVVHGGDGDTVRLPVEAVDVILSVGGDRVAVVDLPVPVGADPVGLASFDAVPAEVPDRIAGQVLEHLADYGEPFILDAAMVGDLWRVDAGVTTMDGAERLYAVWLTADGLVASPADAGRQPTGDDP